MNNLSEAVNKALDRIHLANQMREQLFPDDPFYVAYSGGKDSDVIRILFALADVPHELWHNHTTVDAPETVRYIRQIPNININMPEKTMWQLIIHKGMPPTRLIRYCCEKLKEQGGVGRFTVTGVRWAESSRRRSIHNSIEILTSNLKNKLILNADNESERRLFETCRLKGKRIFNPIVDWSDEQVWEFLNHYGCESNPLYYQGFKRIGRIGCPLARKRIQLEEFTRYPKYYDAYIRTFDKMIAERKTKGKSITNWETGEKVMRWWLDEQN